MNRLLLRTGLVFFALLWPCGNPTYAQEQPESPLAAAGDPLVQKIREVLAREKKTSVVVADFLSSRGMVTEFSRAAAEQVARSLAAAGPVRVVEPPVVRDHLGPRNLLAVDLEVKDIAHIVARTLNAETVMTG